MKKIYRKAVSLCLLLAVTFMIVGIAAADDSLTPAASPTIFITFPPGGLTLTPTDLTITAVPAGTLITDAPTAAAAAA